MKINTAKKPIYTHEGAKACHISPELQLRRSVMSCFLWENEFYEDGQSISDRIVELCKKVKPEFVHSLATEARKVGNLRHVPLLLLSECPNANAIYETISRADELSEMLAIYWRNGRKPISAQMKRGLAKAFTKFDAYQLAKYNRDGAIKLRDVLFMVHAKPKDAEQEKIWKSLIDGTLASPDTWEVALSSGADKKETFERLLSEGNLGYMALLRNLRNMVDANVSRELISKALTDRKGASKVLPFRFVAAAKAAPSLEPYIDAAMAHSIDALPKLKGRTLVLVDISVSMDAKLSGKSDMSRIEAACVLASMVQSDEVRIFSFSAGRVRYYGEHPNMSISKEVPPRKGMACVDAIANSQTRGGTLLGQAVKEMNDLRYDRLIVITDEQSQDKVPNPEQENAYMINVASAKNGIGYGKWTHIDGFSENVIRFIHEIENNR